MRRTVLLLVGLLVAAPAAAGPIPDDFRREWKLGDFYQKVADSGGVPVVGSAKVSDAALAEAAWVVGRMLDGRPDLAAAMRTNRVRVAVMAANEFTTDLPEHARMTPKLFWDRRARGLGATLSNPVVSCGEENLLGHPGDPYPNENILVHEFAHAVHGTGLSSTDRTFDGRLRAAFRAAGERKLWANTYAATNPAEYWAEGVQSWFDDNAPPDALHNAVRTRAKLKEYDPTLAALCKEVFGDRDWRYTRPAVRPEAERTHLPGYDPAALPRFRWRETPPGDRPRATIQTAAGDFDVELDGKSPATAVFLKTALDGGYHSGRFETVRGVVRATASPKWQPPAKQEDVPAATEKPTDGTIALVRGGPTAAFVLVVGEPAEVGDVVPFGRVTKGADVLRKLLAADAGVDIRRVIRTQ